MADAIFYPPEQSNPRASFSGNAGESPTFEAEIKTTRHEKLNGRDLQNQHPIGAITGLQEALNSKQPTINDLEDIRAGANKGSSAVQPNELEAVAETIPHNASDINALPDTTKYGASILASLNQSTFVITIQLKDQQGNNLGSAQTIDLPLESVVVDGTYDSTNKKIILTLENGNTIDVPVGDLVAGLQTEITSQNKLSADLVDDSNSANKFTTTQEKSAWNGKQDAINDLNDIRDGASAGATALQPSSLNGYATETWVGQQGFLTSTALAGYATQQWVQNQGYATSSALSGYVPYSGATGAVDLNAKDLKNVDNLAVGTATVDNNEKILSVGQNRIVSNNANGLFISSTTSQTRKGMYGVPMALEIQFNSNNQAYSYPLGFHDMNSNNNGGQFLFTSFSSNIGAATAGDVMVENDKGGLIFNTGNSKSGSKMRFTVGNWQSTPQITVTANGVGIKTNNPNSSYALDVNGILNSSDVLINGQPIGGGDANVQYISGGGASRYMDLSSLYVDSQGANYSFYYDSNYGDIRNNNQYVDDSYAYAYIEFYLDNDSDVTIYFSQDSEQNYDYGEISELDEYLSRDNQEDTSYVAWTGKNSGSISDSVTFSNVTSGTHFFTIKYIKDGSSYTGEDTFEITSIEVSGSGGSLVDTDTQEEIPLSQLNDMPQALQAIREEIPDTSNFVTIDTKQMMTAPKAITGTDTPWGSDQVQKNLFMAVSNSNTTSVVEWIGRSMFGANNLTFLMGTINRMAALGAHSWTSAKQGTGAAWADIYVNPDGDKAVKIGGSPMVGRPSIMVIQNLGQTTTGTVKINRRPQLTQSALYKDVACWDDSVTKFDFTQISGYNASVNQTLTHDSSGNLKWVNS